MAKFKFVPREGAGKREKTIVKLKLVVEILLQKKKSTHDVLSGPIFKSSPPRDHRPPTLCNIFNDDDELVEEACGGSGVPADVKEGHFAVFAATEEGEVKRFVVPLSYLEYPPFMRLLKEAEEEYGFGGCHGVLTVPCHPNELERLLSHHHHQHNRRRASGSFMLNRITNWVDLST